MSELDALVDRRPMILKLAESQSGIARKNLYTPAWSLGIPQKDSKNYKEAMAMDACCRNILSGALKNDIALSAFPLFVGYGFLSNLAQEGLIRAGVETIADDMTRKPIELYYDDEGGEEEEDKITKLKAEMVKYKVRERMNTAMLKDGYFGGCLVYIDVGELEDDEAELPLVLDEKTFKKGSLRGFKVIEPVNIAPGTYNTTDPTADDYFNPNWYYILGRKFHKSRFLYIASNETPLLLKAAYNFFGIPQAQLALDYVAHFVANRESAQELLNKFSLTCFGTDMSQGLQANGSWADLVKRMKMFNKMKNNNGTFVYNKETEELSQINTPLGGVREIVEMSLNLLTAIWRIPKIRYIGEGEGGLNASSVEQMRSYYDYINAMQEKVLTVPYETILKVLQLNLGMTPDEKLMFKFPVLWDMDEQERANLNKIKADTMATYLANGIISQEEARRSLSMDRNSGFTMIDAEDVPEPVEEPLKDVDKEEQDEEDKQAMDMAMDEFVESEHPRNKLGKFIDKAKKLFTNKQKDVIISMSSFINKEMGTYDLKTGKRKDYNSGYSVTFHQNEPDDEGNFKSRYGRYTEKEYDDLTNEIASKYGADVNVGVFDGVEISFWVKSRKDALELMKKYNQHSIWDWSKSKNGGNGIILNPDYDSKKNPMEV